MKLRIHFLNLINFSLIRLITILRYFLTTPKITSPDSIAFAWSMNINKVMLALLGNLPGAYKT